MTFGLKKKPIINDDGGNLTHSTINSGKEESHIEHANGEMDHQEFPEGGWGWVVIAGCFILTGTNFGMVNAYGEYQKYYVAHFPKQKQSVLTLIGSLQPATVYFSSIFAAKLIHHISPRNSLIIGGIIVSFSFMMASICKEVWQLALAQGVVFGLGTSITVLVCFSIPQQWFQKKRATAIGIMSSGSSIGGVVWPLAVQHLIKQVGFGWANRIIGFIYIPLFAFAAFTVRSPEPRPENTNGSSISALKSDLENYSQESLEIKNKDIPDSQSRSNNNWLRRNVFHSHFLIDWTVLKNYQFLLLLFGTFLGTFALFVPLFFLPSFAVQLANLKPSVADNILTIINSASVLGRILPGLVGDKIGRLNAFIISVILSGVFVLALWLPCHGEALLIVLALLFGFSSGAFVSLPPAVIGQLFGIDKIKDRMSLFLLSCFPGSFVGAVIAGSFLPTSAPVGDTSGYPKLIIFSGVFFLGSAAVLTIARLTFSRQLLAFV